MKNPRVFISYSSPDRPPVEIMAKSLRNVDVDAWIDRELHGGGTWWAQILDQIEQTDVLVYALSEHARRSKACQAERAYARALRKPVLIVRIDDIDLARTQESFEQIFDYDPQSVDSFITLLNEVKRLGAMPPVSVDPKPERPPVPGAYIHDFVVQLDADELTWTQQSRLLEDIKLSLKKEEDPRTRDDLMVLLQRLSRRPDVVKDVDAAIVAYLAQVAPPASPVPPASPSPLPATQVMRPTPPRRSASASSMPPRVPPESATPSASQAVGPRPRAEVPAPRATPPGPSTGPTSAPGPRTGNVLSTVAFVLAGLGLFTFGLVAWAGAVVAGIGLSRKDPHATAALWTSLAVAVAGLVLLVVLVAATPSDSGFGTDTGPGF
ncbi:TIR domain-containing protein [Isoptericola sp. NPDC057559]|uniref:TIR domain-containing protein n=1 Tax=Isoptericola sp. NPDC057559 TaxID=3346168 RepID=UPI00367C109E